MTALVHEAPFQLVWTDFSGRQLERLPSGEACVVRVAEGRHGPAEQFLLPVSQDGAQPLVHFHPGLVGGNECHALRGPFECAAEFRGRDRRLRRHGP